MSEQAQQTAPTAHLYAALAKAIKRANAVEKDARNDHHKYAYASAEAIIAESREALAAEGLSLIPLSIGRDPERPDHTWSGEGDDAFIDIPRRLLVVSLLTHESGEAVELRQTFPVIPSKGRPEDKCEFGGRTENLAYLLRDLLQLPRVGAETPSSRDDNGYRPQHQAPRTQAPPARAPQQARAHELSPADSKAFEPDEVADEVRRLNVDGNALKKKPVTPEAAADYQRWKERAQALPSADRGGLRTLYNELASKFTNNGAGAST